MKDFILIRNRPIGHYLLSIFSLLLQDEKEIILKSYGSLNGKNADIANMISKHIMPGIFDVDFQTSCEKVKSINDSFNCSTLTTVLKRKEKFKEKFSTDRKTKLGTVMEVNICELEFLVNLFLRNGIDRLWVGTPVRREELEIGEIDLASNVISINSKFPEGKTGEGEEFQRPKLVDALIRASIIKPDLESHKEKIAQWDDVIFGLDTNLFYSCAITSFILDAFLKIPYGDFIDSPDWITLVLSKVAMSEIENYANYSKDPLSLHRRLALRAIQEIMIIHKSKDLEGVSMFLTGFLPPEMSFTSKAMVVRDSLIRQHFREFLKNLDFYKGSFFLTSDFNNATLAEAEGLVPLYIRMPHLGQTGYKHKLFIEQDKINVSEIIYEMSVTFLPLILKADGITLKIKSIWNGKNLKDWENWKLKITWEKDELGVKSGLEKWLNMKVPRRMVQGWKDLKERYVSWVK